jgi:hypothetical protein
VANGAQILDSLITGTLGVEAMTGGEDGPGLPVAAGRAGDDRMTAIAGDPL